MLPLLLLIWRPSLLTALSTFPPTDPDVKTLKSPSNPNIIVRFKSPTPGTCTTVFPSQKQYAGYVSIPPSTLAPIQQDYTINTFFWFFEARTNPATSPLTIYINGGPGSSSMVGLFQEAGPCEVFEVAKGQLGTRARDWGWDRSSNLLFIDQPNQVGFSFDVPTNGSRNTLTDEIIQPPAPVPSGQPANTFLDGTFSSNNMNSTANTTEIAGHAIWHMLQAFLGTFPQYNPGSSSKSTKTSSKVGVNLFAESYGGRYGPIFASIWEEQNSKRGNLSGSTNSSRFIDIQLESLGIIQGCVDDSVQAVYYPRYANDNPYGFKALSVIQQQASASSFFGPEGCQQLIRNCRTAVNASDPSDDGDDPSVNDICRNATATCQLQLTAPFLASGRNPYDITQKMNDPFPPSTYMDYLNDASVQAAIGVPVNYTESTDTVSDVFQHTGDFARTDPIRDLASLLSKGVRIALLYGDRDYLCNWLGGEEVSFAIAAQTEGYSPFYSAGYADIVVNTTYIGGVVRQYGNLSFSRVYNAGHLVPAYQPETAFTIFTRIIRGNDLSFGQDADLASYTTHGPANSTRTFKPPKQADPVCYLRDAKAKCSDEQLEKLAAGKGTVINGAWYANEKDWKGGAAAEAAASSASGKPAPGETTTTATTTVPTGVFTATATPTAKQDNAAAGRGVGGGSALLILIASFLGVTVGFAL